jgi:hypothetical protein
MADIGCLPVIKWVIVFRKRMNKTNFAVLQKQCYFSLHYYLQNNIVDKMKDTPLQKRGIEAIESEASILKDFSNIAVHNSSYFKITQAKHILCVAHLLRNEKLTNSLVDWHN